MIIFTAVVNMKESNFKLLNFFKEFFFIPIFTKKIYLKKIVVILMLVISNTSFSQETIQNQRVWFAYTGQFKVSEKWGYHIEGQFRMDNELQQSFQNLFRIGGIYYLSNSKTVTGGYALVNTYSKSFDAYFKENRLWEQFQYSKKWHNEKHIFVNRFRLEQRWVEQLTTVINQVNTSNYQNRFRYLNRNLFHLTNLKSINGEIYAVLQNEVFLNLGDNEINNKLIDQNRFLVGLGFNYNNNVRLELGYLNNYINSSTSYDAMNHTVSVSLFQNLDLQKH